jgi:hypothetical protein
MILPLLRRWAKASWFSAPEKPTSKMESGMHAARRMEDYLHSSSLLLVEKTFANLVLLI